MQILIIDDDPLAAGLIAALLEEAGHEVTMADNALDGLAALEATPGIEAIISDMNMPLMSGLELFETLAVQAEPRPFVLLTGDDPAPLQTAHPGLAACLQKDDELETMLPVIISALKARA